MKLVNILLIPDLVDNNSILSKFNQKAQSNLNCFQKLNVNYWALCASFFGIYYFPGIIKISFGTCQPRAIKEFSVGSSLQGEVVIFNYRFSVQILNRNVHNIIATLQIFFQIKPNMLNPSKSQNSKILSSYQQCLKINTQQMNEHNLHLLHILNAQNLVIQKLLENQNMLQMRIQETLRYETTDTENNYNYGATQGSQNSTDGDEKNRVVKNIITKSDSNSAILQSLQDDKAPKCQIKLVCNMFSDASLNSDKMETESQGKDDKEPKKVCETKNIIKNYGKSILTFIRKNEKLTQNVLEEFGIDFQEFNQELDYFKCRVNSITDLKLFWTAKGNKFDKVFRILSNIYLKKHSLKHTFCSRVRNHSVHIKYRKRLLQVLESPESFNSIKYF